MEETNCSIKFSWSSLPSAIIANIFKYLDDSDRFNASMVCRSWAYAFREPSLWKVKHFIIEDSSLNRDLSRAVGFAACFPSTPKEIQITFIGHRYPRVRMQCHLLTNFFDLMTGRAALDKFHFRNYWFHRSEYPIPALFFDEVTGALKRFLESQRTLVILELSGCYFNESEGLEILNSLTQECVDCIEELNIKNYFDQRTNGRYQALLRRFRNLGSLSLNYNCLSTDVLDILSINCGLTLKFLNVTCCHKEPHRHAIRSDSWRNFRKSCTGLAVNFFIDEVVDATDFKRILQQEIPLQGLTYKSGHTLRTHGNLENDGATIVQYVNRAFSERLEQACLDFGYLKVPLLDAAVQDTLKVCKKLHSLSVEGIFPVTLAEELCITALERTEPMKQLKMVFNFLSYEDFIELDAVRSLYRHQLEQRWPGLEFEVLCSII